MLASKDDDIGSASEWAKRRGLTCQLRWPCVRRRRQRVPLVGNERAARAMRCMEHESSCESRTFGSRGIDVRPTKRSNQRQLSTLSTVLGSGQEHCVQIENLLAFRRYRVSDAPSSARQLDESPASRADFARGSLVSCAATSALSTTGCTSLFRRSATGHVPSDGGGNG